MALQAASTHCFHEENVLMFTGIHDKKESLQKATRINTLLCHLIMEITSLDVEFIRSLHNTFKCLRLSPWKAAMFRGACKETHWTRTVTGSVLSSWIFLKT